MKRLGYRIEQIIMCKARILVVVVMTTVYKATVYLVMLDNQFIHPRPADEAHAVTG